MANKRIFDLSEGGKSLLLSIIVDGSSLLEARHLLLIDLLQTRVVYAQTGTGSVTCNFTNREQIELTLSSISASSSTITLANILDDTKYFLKVTKPTAKTLLFSGTDVQNVGATYTPTVCYFEITSVAGYVAVKRIDNFISSSVGGQGVTIEGATINNIVRWNYIIKDNICFFDIEVDLYDNSSDTVELTYPFGYSPVNTNDPLTISIASLAYAAMCERATVGADEIIRIKTAAALGDTTYNINGQFLIK